MDTQYLYDGNNFKVYIHEGRYTNRKMGSARHYLNCITKGRSKYITPSGTVEIGPGTLFYIPMGMPYEVVSWPDAGVFELHSCGFVLFPETKNKNFKFQTLPDEFVEEFLQIPLNQQPDSKTISVFYGLVDRLLPYMEVQEQAPKLLEKLSKLILEDPMARIPDLAQRCGMSESSLFMNVKKLAGKTPNEYRIDVLIAEAVRLLASTDVPIHEIHERLGFNSANYFRELFKKYMILTPYNFRIRSRIYPSR